MCPVLSERKLPELRARKSLHELWLAASGTSSLLGPSSSPPPLALTPAGGTSLSRRSGGVNSEKSRRAFVRPRNQVWRRAVVKHTKRSHSTRVPTRQRRTCKKTKRSKSRTPSPPAPSRAYELGIGARRQLGRAGPNALVQSARTSLVIQGQRIGIPRHPARNSDRARYRDTCQAALN